MSLFGGGSCNCFCHKPGNVAIACCPCLTSLVTDELQKLKQENENLKEQLKQSQEEALKNFEYYTGENWRLKKEKEQLIEHTHRNLIRDRVVYDHQDTINALQKEIRELKAKIEITEMMPDHQEVLVLREWNNKLTEANKQLKQRQETASHNAIHFSNEVVRLEQENQKFKHENKALSHDLCCKVEQNDQFYGDLNAMWEKNEKLKEEIERLNEEKTQRKKDNEEEWMRMRLIQNQLEERLDTKTHQLREMWEKIEKLEAENIRLKSSSKPN